MSKLLTTMSPFKKYFTVVVVLTWAIALAFGPIRLSSAQNQLADAEILLGNGIGENLDFDEKEIIDPEFHLDSGRHIRSIPGFGNIFNFSAFFPGPNTKNINPISQRPNATETILPATPWESLTTFLAQLFG